jgi:hypothetical protein
MPRIARSYSMPCAESLGQMHGEITMDQWEWCRWIMERASGMNRFRYRNC